MKKKKKNEKKRKADGERERGTRIRRRYSLKRWSFHFT
jgi:hypothetical protein